MLRAHCTAGTRTRCSPTPAASRQRAVAVPTAPHALKACADGMSLRHGAPAAVMAPGRAAVACLLLACLAGVSSTELAGVGTG
jgi:hypothetical protein